MTASCIESIVVCSTQLSCLIDNLIKSCLSGWEVQVLEGRGLLVELHCQEGMKPELGSHGGLPRTSLPPRSSLVLCDF